MANPKIREEMVKMAIVLAIPSKKQKID